MNLDDLRRELAQVGMRPRRADRIVTEFEDHLASNPDAPLGEPEAIARQFANELGTGLARRASFRAFLCWRSQVAWSARRSSGFRRRAVSTT